LSDRADDRTGRHAVSDRYHPRRRGPQRRCASPLAAARCAAKPSTSTAPAFAQDPLSSWNDTAPKTAIVAFVEKVTKEGSPDFVPPNERIATFDNDGTLWCADGAREFAYGAESKIGTFSDALMAEAKKNAWTVISMKDDWKKIFAFEP
jgi:hypothetical protein